MKKYETWRGGEVSTLAADMHPVRAPHGAPPIPNLPDVMPIPAVKSLFFAYFSDRGRTGWFPAALAATGLTVLCFGLVACSEGTAAHPGEKGRPESAPSSAPAAASAARSALTVTTTRPQESSWSRILRVSGNIAPWQEASVGAEVGGVRILQVTVNVGAPVKRGQVLARLQDQTVAADLAGAKAAVAEALANAAEARANAERARQLRDQGFVSEQNVTQTAAAEQAARARLDAQRARLQTEQLRMAQTQVVAPDDGVISARQATVGAVVQPGQELFRLIRGGRLEWRAEVSAADLSRVGTGQPVRVTLADGSTVSGLVRTVAPTVDAATRNGLVYVDLRSGGSARSGMFASGEIRVGSASALSLPQSAVLLRDGFSYVFRVMPAGRVSQVKVGVGSRQGDRVEVLSGLTLQDAVVASGVGFLSDGDVVTVVGTAPAPSPASSPITLAPGSEPRVALAVAR